VRTVTMVVNVYPSRLLLRSFSLARSRQACRDSVWVHLVLSGRYGNLDHPLLPSRHPLPSSLRATRSSQTLALPLSLPCSFTHIFSFSSVLSAYPFLFRSFPLPSSSAALSFSCSCLYPADAFRTILFFFPVYGRVRYPALAPFPVAVVDRIAPVG